jgi:hypothetical protein
MLNQTTLDFIQTLLSANTSNEAILEALTRELRINIPFVLYNDGLRMLHRRDPGLCLPVTEATAGSMTLFL